MFSELFEQLNSIGPYKPQVHYHHGSPESERDHLVRYLFPRAFEYDSRSRVMEKRWENYNNQEVFVVNVDNDGHVKILLMDLIYKRIVPFHIIVVSSKPPEMLGEREILRGREFDDFIDTHEYQKPDVFFKKYINHDDIETLGSNDGIILVRIKDTRCALDIFKKDELVRYSLERNLNIVFF
jgi:hypothetical protein